MIHIALQHKRQLNVKYCFCIYFVHDVPTQRSSV